MRRLSLVLSLLLLSACDTSLYIRDSFVVAVDNIVVPDTIAASDTLRVKLYGTVGDTDCHKLKGIEVEKVNPTLVRFAVLGVYESTGSCSPRLLELGGAEVKVAPPFADPLTLSVEQPRDSAMVHTVVVR